MRLQPMKRSTASLHGLAPNLLRQWEKDRERWRETTKRERLEVILRGVPIFILNNFVM